MKVLVLDDYLDIARGSADWSLLGHDAQVRVLQEHLASREARLRELRPFDVVVAMRERTPFPADLLEALPNLRLLVTTGTRNNSIDLAACQRLGITVCAAPGDSSGSAPAELAWGLILGLVKRIPMEHQALLAGRWQTGATGLIAGKRLGVVGLGKLGSQVAKVGAAFGMEVVAWSPNLTDERAAAAGVTRVGKADLFATADVVSLHLVASPATAGIVSRADLRAMKPSAFLVNTARAELVEAGALEEALAAGWIAGAGLDVFRTEPLPPDDPLRGLPNVILVPHLGYVTPETMTAFYRNAVEAIVAWAAGKPIRVLAPQVAA
ncbi:MAG: D-2-hydroxyacid dehydrogenase family protein [Burkholderiaceae bacterium]|nr:D-2-hydroxyacid dehydrogenase family protein [Burkholderiaceae bacterium]